MTNAALRRPITFAPSPPYEESFRALRQNAARLWGYALRHPVAVSFAVGFAVRLVPELLWWPWLVGWDTVEYAAHLEDFLADPRFFSAYYWMGSMRNMPPMIDWVLSVPALLFGSWSVYKLYPPVAYGLVCALSALISRRVLRMGSRWSILTGAVSALFILNLRISWDYQRQTIGTIFLMAFLAYSWSGSIPGSSSALSGTAGGKGSTAGGWKRAAASSALLVCSALSHEVTAFASAVALLYLTAQSAQRRSIAGSSTYAASLVCTVFLLLWYWGAPAYESRYLGTLPAGFVANLSERGQVVSYLVAGFGALLPLALLSLRRVNGAYASAVLGLVAAGVSPIVASYTSVTTWYRFLIGAAPLAVPMAMKTLSESGRKGTAALVILLLVAPGVAFTMPNGGIYTATLVGAIREFPAAMTPSPASATSQEGLLKDASGALAFAIGGEPLVAYSEHARFLHLFTRNPTPGEFVWSCLLNLTNGRLIQPLP